MPKITILAPGLEHSKVCRIVSLWPADSIAQSTPLPSVISKQASIGLSILELIVCVAPTFFANSNLLSKISTAIIFDAPDILAPWIALNPTAPHPITTTEVSGFIFPAYTAPPYPVITAQPNIDALSRGKSFLTFTAPCLGIIVYSAWVETRL